MEQKTIAGWTIEYNKEATQTAYAELPNDTLGCNCKTCCNFMKATPTVSKTILAFFEQFGIELLKPAEIYENYSENGRVFYGGWYHIVGNYLTGDDVWQPVNKDPNHKHIAPMFQVDDEFKVGFTKDLALVPQGFPTPILQMEVVFSLPWVLEEPYEKN